MKKFAVVSLLTSCLMLAGLSSAPAQESPNAFAALSLSAAAERPKVLLGEPMSLKVRLTNPTQLEVEAPPSLDPGGGMIQVYVSRDGGEFKRYLGPGWGTAEATNAAPRIAPGETLSSDITLFFNNAVGGRDDLLAGHLPLNEAGTYQIRVVLFDTTFRRKIAAPVIDVQVGYPTSPDEQAVWQTVQADADLAYFMQTGDARRAGEVVSRAKQLVRLYPDNIQSKHLALALGRYYLGQDKAETATVYLKGAATTERASSLRAQALLELVRSYAAQGEVDEALRIGNAASNEYAEPGVRQEFERLGSQLRLTHAPAQTGKGQTPR